MTTIDGDLEKLAILLPSKAWAPLLQGIPGLSFGKQEAKTGWNAQPTCAVTLDAVRVPADNLLGQEGQGFSIAMNACKHQYLSGFMQWHLYVAGGWYSCGLCQTPVTCRCSIRV